METNTNREIFRFSNYRTGIQALDKSSKVLEQLHKDQKFKITLSLDNTKPQLICVLNSVPYKVNIGDHLELSNNKILKIIT